MYNILRLQWFNICRQTNGATIKPKISILARQPDDIINVIITRCQRKLQCK